MRSFKWPPTLLPHCSQCFHRPISTTATATGKRRKDRSNNKRLEGDLQERASILRARIWEARVARREDWILGPLAPRRDTGTDNYGTMAARELRGVKGGLGVGILTQRASGGVTAAGKRGGKKGEGVGMSWKESLIYEGDRVAVLSGEGPESRELGRIGKVRNVRRAEREVLIDDFNLVDIQVPPAMLVRQPNAPKIRAVPLPIPLSSVRLVHKVPDPDTGIETDKIISCLIPLPDEKKAEIREECQDGGISQQEMENRLRGRTIPGSKEVYGRWLEIPLPALAKHQSNKKGHKQHHGADDTSRLEVERKTWTPTLLRAPMPGGVIDELRNKYSRFRTRHDADYQLALDNRARRKAEYKAWVESGGGMLVTPAQEAGRAERAKLKEERGEPTLEKEVLERIGEVMAERGIEMTGKRRREVERNLKGGERVVRWGSDVEVPGKGMKNAERATVLEEEEEGENAAEDANGGDEQEWEEDDMEGRDGMGDVVNQQDRQDDIKRPTL